METQYTFRVDEVEGVTRQSVVDWFRQQGFRHAVFLELGEVTRKVHYQGWFYSSLGQCALQNRVKKQWPAVCGARKGRSSSHYSVAKVRKSTYEAYCCKGESATEGPDVVSMSGVDVDAEILHRQWWSTQASSSPRKVHIVSEGIEVFQHYEWPEEYADNVYHKRQVVLDWMCEKLCARQVGLDTYRSRCWLNGIVCAIDPGCKARWKQEVVDKW